MASRWRTWDTDFFTDAHSSRQPEETEVIPAVGLGRGKLPKNIASLNLPKAALGITKVNKSDGRQAPIGGRGRGSVMKTRALTSSPPVRRPGEKPAKVDRLEGFPPLQAAVNKCKTTPNSPKCQKNPCSNSSSSASQPRPEASSLSHPSKDQLKDDLLSTTDGRDVVVIENLPPTLTEQELIDLFRPYGDVLAGVIERDGSGQNLGTALVRMENRNACEWIINAFTGEEYPGASGPMVCRFLTE